MIGLMTIPLLYENHPSLDPSTCRHVPKGHGDWLCKTPQCQVLFPQRHVDVWMYPPETNMTMKNKNRDASSMINHHVFFLLCVCVRECFLYLNIFQASNIKNSEFLRRLTSQTSKNHEPNHLRPLNPDPHKMSAAISGGQRSRGGGCLGKVTPSKINSHWVFLWWEKINGNN